MAWPPPLPPTGRTNETAQFDAHPDDHNRIATYLTKLVATGTMATPFKRADNGVALVPGTSGINTGRWTRIGPRVFVDLVWNSGASGWNFGGANVEVRVTPPFPISASYPTAGLASPRLGGFQLELTTQGSVWANWDLANSGRFILISGITAAVLQSDLLGKANGLVAGTGSYLTDVDP